MPRFSSKDVLAVFRCAGEDQAQDVRSTVHGDSGCAHNSSSHQCPHCKVSWPLPRKIQWPEVASPQNTLDGLLKNPPTTTDTLVVYQTFTREGLASIPAEVFKSFTFATEGEEGKEGNRNLVQGIRYSKGKSTGQPGVVRTCTTEDTSLRRNSHESRAEEDRERDHAYLRLVTLNNWYASLFNTLSLAMMMSMEIQGNVMLSAALLSDGELITALGNLRYLFIAFFPVMLLVSVLSACFEASVEWAMKTSPSKGDLISNTSRWSQWKTYIAMVAFEFFLVEKDVKDIPINLHPWKGMQDYSAFKCEGHRAFFVGYRSKTMHRVENIRSFWFCLPKQLATKLAVLVFKAFLMYRLFVFEGQGKVSLSVVAATISSLVSVIWDFTNLVHAYRIRDKFYTRLIARLKRNETEDSQYRADVRLLGLHFRCWWDSERHQAIRFGCTAMKKFIGLDPFATPNEKCTACGRKPIKKGEPTDKKPMQQTSDPKDKDSAKRVSFADLPDASLKVPDESMLMVRHVSDQQHEMPPDPPILPAGLRYQVHENSDVRCSIQANGQKPVDPNPVSLKGAPPSIPTVPGKAASTSPEKHDVGELDPHTGPLLPGCPSAAMLTADLEQGDSLALLDAA